MTLGDLTVLTAAEKIRVSDICKRHRLGEIHFKENGVISITSRTPIARQALQALTDCKILDYGEYPFMEDRPDDMRQIYWVDLMAAAHGFRGGKLIRLQAG